MKISVNTDCFDELEQAIAYQYVLRSSGYDRAERIKPEYLDLGNRLVHTEIWDSDKLSEERIAAETELKTHEVKVLTKMNISGHTYANILIPELPVSDYWIIVSD
jgi:hypothetical protein